MSSRDHRLGWCDQNALCTRQSWKPTWAATLEHWFCCGLWLAAIAALTSHQGRLILRDCIQTEEALDMAWANVCQRLFAFHAHIRRNGRPMSVQISRFSVRFCREELSLWRDCSTSGLWLLRSCMTQASRQILVQETGTFSFSGAGCNLLYPKFLLFCGHVTCLSPN